MEGNQTWNPHYDRFLNVKEDGAIVPGLAQGLVPQSLAYIPDQDWFIISGHRDDLSSLVTVIDATTEQHVKSVQFQNTSGSIYHGHAGGVAVSENHLWISSGGRLHFADLEEFINAEHGDTVPFLGYLNVDTRASFVTVHDGIIWVGDFGMSTSTSYETAEHHHFENRNGENHVAWAAGYPLDPDTDLIPETTPLNEEGEYIPKLVLSIGDQIQGILFYEDYIILSESFGRNNPSNLMIYTNPLDEDPHKTIEINDTSVPLWFLDKLNHHDTWGLTPMVEETAVKDNKIFIVYESGAEKFLDGIYAVSRLDIIAGDVLLDPEAGYEEQEEEQEDTNTASGSDDNDNVEEIASSSAEDNTLNEEQEQLLNPAVIVIGAVILIAIILFVFLWIKKKNFRRK